MFFCSNSKTRSFDLSMDPKHWLESFVISQVFTDKKDFGNPDTGWWAESLEGFDVGSELYKMKRAKPTDENLELALQSVLSAVKRLQEEEAITLFDGFTELQKGGLVLNVQVKPAQEPRMVSFGFRFGGDQDDLSKSISRS